MICKLCGKEVPDGAKYCDGCGSSLAPENTAPAAEEKPEAAPEWPTVGQTEDGQAAAGPTVPETPLPSGEGRPVNEMPPEKPVKKISSHMVMAIVTTVLFGNWALGIPAIVFARECEMAAEKELWDLAERFSGRAMAFAWIGVGINLALGALIALIVVVFAALGPVLFY